MAKAAPGDRDRQHRTGLRDDARHDRAGQRLSGRGPARGRFDGCRHIRDQGRRRRTAFGATPFAEADLAQVAATPGVTAAAPLACAATTVVEGTSRRNVTAFGAPEHGPGMPHVSEGRAPSTPDEVAASSTLGRHVGEDLRVGARTLRIVGIVPNSTALAKTPNIFLTTEGLQQLSYNGQPTVTSIAIKGTPQQIPAGYQTRRSGGRRQRPAAPGKSPWARSRSWPS